MHNSSHCRLRLQVCSQEKTNSDAVFVILRPVNDTYNFSMYDDDDTTFLLLSKLFVELLCL